LDIEFGSKQEIRTVKRFVTVLERLAACRY